MAFYSFFAARAEETREIPYHSGFLKSIAKPFAISTGGRASLDAKIIDALPVTYTVPARGAFTIASQGADAGEPTGGYGRVVRDPGTSAPSGLAIFGLRQNGVLVTEASVPASAPVMSGRIYAEVGGRVNTGLAIANPNDQDVTVAFHFTNELGQNFGNGSTVISAHGQIARFLDQPPFNGGGSIQGTFTFSASAPVGVIALRGYSNERSEFLLTTLPVTDLSLPASLDMMVLPHFADGGGWTTQFALVNSTEELMNGTLQFYSPGTTAPSLTPGIPVQVTLDGQTSNSFNYSIAPRSSRRLRTSGIGASTQVGSVRITPSGGTRAPSAVGIFGFRENGVTVTEAGVPAILMATAYRVYVETSDDFTAGAPGSIQSGVAIANASSSPATINLELTTLDGVSTGMVGTLTVSANGQVSRFFGQIAGFEALSSSFRGVLRVSTSASGVFMLGLRARYNERREFLITTTVPNIESTIAPGTDLFFPQIADGGGYMTQFILFNGTADQSASGSMRFNTPAGQRLSLTFR